MFVLWGAGLGPENVTFKDTVAVNPGILRPNWYGNCAATYGAKSVARMTSRCQRLLEGRPKPKSVLRVLGCFWHGLVGCPLYFQLV